MATPTYLTYRGAVYRKAAAPPVLDPQLLQAAWKALGPEVEKYRNHIQKVIDQVVADANADLQAEFATFNQEVADRLFWALVDELKAGTGGTDAASKKKVRAMAKALHRANFSGKLSAAELPKIFGWKLAAIPPLKYYRMSKYFDPAVRLGAAYLKAVVARLETFL